MSIWIWIAIIALVVYMMYRRQNQAKGQGTCCGGAGHAHEEPKDAGREEKMIEAEETAEKTDETKAA